MKKEQQNPEQLRQTAVSGSTIGFIILDKKNKPLLKDAQLPIYWLKKIAIEDSNRFENTKVQKVTVSW